MKIEADVLKLDGIRHGFFTRQGGVSGGIYTSLNIGLGSDDERSSVLETATGLPASSVLAPIAWCPPIRSTPPT